MIETVTSFAMDGEHLVIGLANSNVEVYLAWTGMLVRSLLGHESGVCYLVSTGGSVQREELSKASSIQLDWVGTKGHNDGEWWVR